MKLMLTSFGITEYSKDVPLGHKSVFHQMPPVITRAASNVFMPDYVTLLLCDQIVLDESSFAALQETPHWTYALVADSLKILHSEGFVELVDFRSIVDSQQPLVQNMLKNDLQSFEYWIPTLRESLDIWSRFLSGYNRILDYDTLKTKLFRTNDFSSEKEVEEYGSNILGGLLHEAIHRASNVRNIMGLVDFIAGKEPDLELEMLLKEVLSSYLNYVNANIILSGELGVGFHDWNDYLPFYRRKFFHKDTNNLEVQKQIQASQALFSVAFPEFSITDTKTLLRVLRDKRIIDLRRLVEEAAAGKVKFDVQFARATFKEVLKIERKASNYRNIASYLTAPLGLIPGLGSLVGAGVQKVAEEVIGRGIDNSLNHSYRWFYMLSDVIEGE